MFQKNVLQRDIEAALGAPKSTDSLLNAKREHGLQFIIDARREQSLADVANLFHGFSEHFAVEPMFPSPPFQAPSPGQGPAWGDTLFVATVYNVAFDDVTASPWDIAHAARIEGGFLRVIPEIPIPRPQSPADAAPLASPVGWEHEAMRIKDAWAEIERRERKPGTGIFIAHPDTGWVDHEVWAQGNLDKARGRNFMPDEDEKDARDPLTGPYPGHGNSTASVMVAPKGGQIVGVAPHSIVIPIRCVSDVKLYPFQPNVMQAVRYAMDEKCPIISLSLGGSAYPFLGAQLVHAAHANIIVVAASGNSIPLRFTVEPANYHEVIGVGGTKYGDKEWEESSWFPAGTVDISAPAAEVRKAAYSGYSNYDISEGTSYATAFMAGVAALWLSCHFPNGYDGKRRRAYECFREHVRRTVRKVPGVGPGLFGIVNAGELMKTEPLRDTKEDIPDEETDLTGAGEVARLVVSENIEAVRSLLGSTLSGQPVAPTEEASVTLEAWTDEVVFILQGNPALRMELSRQLAASTITAQMLRALLAPAASDALRQQLIDAEMAEG